MGLTREQICERTSRKLAAALPSLASLRAMVGLDGFVHEVTAVVEKHTDRREGRYEPVRTISGLTDRIARAAADGQASNYELVVKEKRYGGNAPALAAALAALGMDVTYIGNAGYPIVHPAFAHLPERVRVISIGDPGRTDALEFEDGRLTLGKHQMLHQVDWDHLVARCGREKLVELMQGSDLIGMVNWTMLPHMSRIWAKMLDEAIPGRERHHRRLFVDLADPQNRTHDDILEALKLLGRFQDQVDTVLGLNLPESLEIADVLGLPGTANPEGAIEENAAAIRKELNLACVVIHPRRMAAAATAAERATFAGPFVRQPKTSAGAGDHFNAGFCLGRVLGFALEESLCMGVAASGYYVRHAAAPTGEQLVEFIAHLPAPQDDGAGAVPL